MILKVEVNTREDQYPSGGTAALRSDLEYEIADAVNKVVRSRRAALKSITFVRGKE